MQGSLMIESHVTRMGIKGFVNEEVRRAGIRIARERAALYGYRGRIAFNWYPHRAPGMGRVVEIRIYS